MDTITLDNQPDCAEDSVLVPGAFGYECGNAVDDQPLHAHNCDSTSWLVGVGDFDGVTWEAFGCVTPNVLPDTSVPHGIDLGFVLPALLLISALWRAFRLAREN